MTLNILAYLSPLDHHCHYSESGLIIESPFNKIYIKEYPSCPGFPDRFEITSGDYFSSVCYSQYVHYILFTIERIYQFNNFLFHIDKLFSDIKITGVVENKWQFEIGNVIVTIDDVISNFLITLKRYDTVIDPPDYWPALPALPVTRQFNIGSYEYYYKPNEVINTLLEGSPELRMTTLSQEFLNIDSTEKILPLSNDPVQSNHSSLLDRVLLIINQNTHLLYEQSKNR